MCRRNESWTVLFEMQIVLKIIIIYANSALPSPSPKFPHKKGHTVRLPVGSEEQSWPRALGCNVKGRRLKFMSYLCSVNKMGVCGF